MSINGPRGARAEEIPAIAELANSVFRPNSDASMSDEYPLLYAPENAPNLRIFADGDAPVSLVGMLMHDVWLAGTRHRACLIGSVCTHPDYRGQGLATRLLEDARQRALADGCDLFLISGGRGLYRRQGFVEVGGYRKVTVTPDRLPADGGLRLRPWTEADLPFLVRLHAAEPVRFTRTPQEFLTLLRTDRVVNAEAETQVICPKRAAPLAYVVYRVPGARGLKADELSVEEMAGSRWAVAQALRGLFAEKAVRRIHVEHLDCDVEMAAVACTLGWPAEPHGFAGTVGVIDPMRFWEACAPLFAELLGPETFSRLSLTDGRGLEISYGDEHVRLDGMDAFTELVFLPEHRRGEMDLGLGDGSELAGILDALFPLPLVSYGLNYA